MRAESLLAGWALCGLMTAANAAALPSSTCEAIYPLIEKTLTARGVEQSEVLSPTELDCAAVPGAAGPFAVEDVKWDAERRVFQFRMACREGRRCLPFLVPARAPEAKSAMIRKQLEAAAEGSQERLLPGQPARAPSPKRVLVRAGRAATLLVERNGMRIRAAVTCLERGGPGEVVRVRLKDSRQLFRAEVIGADLVKLF